MLTYRQRQLFDYLEAEIGRTGTAPTYQEMASAIGTRSKSRPQELVRALVERGYVRRIPNRSRAIEIVPRDALPVAIFSFNNITKTLEPMR